MTPVPGHYYELNYELGAFSLPNTNNKPRRLIWPRGKLVVCVRSSQEIFTYGRAHEALFTPINRESMSLDSTGTRALRLTLPNKWGVYLRHVAPLELLATANSTETKSI